MKIETLYKTRRDLAKRSMDDINDTKRYFEDVIPIIITLCKMNNLDLYEELMRVINIGLDTSLDMYKNEYDFYNEMLDISAE